jgi:hypothetical protein
VLDELLDRLKPMPPPEQAEVYRPAEKIAGGKLWRPDPGPQTQTYLSLADVVLYGGSGGAGKSDLLLGLAFCEHQRSLLFRRQYTDLGALIDRAIQINGSRIGFNGGTPPKLRTRDGRLIEFGAARSPGDETTWQGQPHDLLGLDEGTQLHKSQVQFLMGWVRTVVPGQRTRVVIASNPPLSAEGLWVIEMFRPWLDTTHPNPAKPGELRWFVTDPDGKDMEVDGPEPVVQAGRKVTPKSRTFIPAKLSDNYNLAATDYQATLDGLPEPLRTAIRDGNFMAVREDDLWQIIPSLWIREAQTRWTPQPPIAVPMCCLAADVAQGGTDKTVLAHRYDGWFGPLVTVPGSETPDGPSVAGLVMQHRLNGCAVVIDMGGGYGGSAYDHLRSNGIEAVPYKGAEGSNQRTIDGTMKFVNKRTETLWRFREALDPSQQGGSQISLPDDPELMADLVAAKFTVTPQGIKAQTKQDVIKNLGRSPDKGDAVTMCWAAGARAMTHASIWRKTATGPSRVTVKAGHGAAKRRR